MPSVVPSDVDSIVPNFLDIVFAINYTFEVNMYLPTLDLTLLAEHNKEKKERERTGMKERERTGMKERERTGM